MTVVRIAAAGALLAGVLLGACGDDDDASTATDDATTSTPDQTGAVELVADVPSQVEAGPVTWTIDVTNVTDEELTVTFPTSQPGEAMLIDDSGEVVHRWSDEMLFTQRIEEVTLAPGETRSYSMEDDLSEVEPGLYDLVLELAITHPPEPPAQTIEVVRPG